MRVLIIALLVGSTQAFPYTKDRYLIHCQVKNEGDQRFLQEQVSNNAVDVWGSVEGFGNSTKRILASQEQVEQLQSRLQCDRAMDIRKLEEEVKRKDLLLKSTTPGFFSEYQSYAKIQQQLHSYKGSGNLAIKVERIGQSYEGREISVIRLTLVKATASPTRKIWLSCGQHAREWIAPAACLYLVDKLIESFGSDTRVTRMLKTYEVLVAPLINPDGYEYSRTSYRYWRKNRHPFPSGGIGVDLNRNWNTTHFGEIDIYRGPYAGSEPEVAYTSKYVKSLVNLAAGIDVHSYGELILRNWGWTTSPCKDEVYFKKIGDAIASRMNAINGEGYISQRSGELYPASGSMDDWIYEATRAMGMTVELRDRGDYGFLLPAMFILPTGEELFEGVLTLSEQLSK